MTAGRPGLSDPAILLATWFGAGLMKPAPGTWGSLAALPFAALALYLGGAWLLLACVLAITLAGIWAAGRFNRLTGSHDSGAIVIDEVAGQWIALLWLPFTWQSFAMAFLLFRAFDILKPWPIRWLDQNIEGGLGVMADDLLAGLYALVLAQLITAYLL
jgi:phosphatidylglycerophosphatase A